VLDTAKALLGWAVERVLRENHLYNLTLSLMSIGRESVGREDYGHCAVLEDAQR